MMNRWKICGPAIPMSRRDSLVAAGLTIGASLVVAAVMIVGDDPLTETIGLTMFPGVLVLPAQWMYLRGRSRVIRLALLVGPLAVLFLIGLLAGLAVRG